MSDQIQNNSGSDKSKFYFSMCVSSRDLRGALWLSGSPAPSVFLLHYPLIVASSLWSKKTTPVLEGRRREEDCCIPHAPPRRSCMHPFFSQPIDQNFNTWPHLVAKEAREYSLYSERLCAQLHVEGPIPILILQKGEQILSTNGCSAPVSIASPAK